MFGKNSKVDAVASSVMQVIEKVTTDTTKGREDGSINSYTPSKVTLKGDVEKTPEPKEPAETPARKSIEAKKKPTNEAFVQKLKAGAKKVLAKVGGGSDEDMKKDLQRKMGIPQTGKVGMAKQNEEVEQLDEGKMDAMSLSHLWHAHAKHSYVADQGYDNGSGSPRLNDHAATAIENHVRKHHGNKVADDMVTHSDHHVAHAEYVGGKEAKDVESSAAKLRAKHKIKGDLYGMHNESVTEGWDDMMADVKAKRQPQPNGGSGVKKGKSYGNQKPEKEVKEGYEDSAEDKAEDKKEAKKRHMSMKEWEKSAADKKQDMKEAKTLSPGQDDAPFDPPYSPSPKTVTDKSGAKHTPMSRAKNLARAAMDKIKKDHKLG